MCPVLGVVKGGLRNEGERAHELSARDKLAERKGKAKASTYQTWQESTMCKR